MGPFRISLVVVVAFFDSRASRFLIDDADGVRRDLSAYLTEVGGLPGARGLTEVTALGDDGVSFVVGLEERVDYLEGPVRRRGPDAVLGPHVNSLNSSRAPCMDSAGSLLNRRQEGSGTSPVPDTLPIFRSRISRHSSVRQVVDAR